jgi:hypothetical protein
MLRATCNLALFGQPPATLMPPRRARPFGLSCTLHFSELLYGASQNDRGALPVCHRQQTAMIGFVAYLQGSPLSGVAVNAVENRLGQYCHCFWRVRWHANSLGV